MKVEDRHMQEAYDAFRNAAESLRPNDPDAKVRMDAVDKAVTFIATALAKAEAREREECAKVAESHSDDRGGRDRPFDWHDGYQDGCRGAAAAIRARSKP
jgi:hypothetical protein